MPLQEYCEATQSSTRGFSSRTGGDLLIIRLLWGKVPHCSHCMRRKPRQQVANKPTVLQVKLWYHQQNHTICGKHMWRACSVGPYPKFVMLWLTFMVLLKTRLNLRSQGEDLALLRCKTNIFWICVIWIPNKMMSMKTRWLEVLPQFSFRFTFSFRCPNPGSKYSGQGRIICCHPLVPRTWGTCSIRPPSCPPKKYSYNITKNSSICYISIFWLWNIFWTFVSLYLSRIHLQFLVK